MSEHAVHDLVVVAVPVFITVGFYGAYMVWWTPERRRADAWKWAERHFASHDERWLEPVERQMLTNLRIDVVGMFLLTFVLMLMPTSGKAYAGCLVAVPPVLAIARGLAFNRTVLPPGERVARLRELTVGDYLPRSTRLLMWRSGAGGCLTCMLLGVTRGQWLVAASGLLLVAAPATVDLAGTRLARMPQPADSAAHLYTQDAFRSDLIRSAALRSATGGVFVCLLVSWAMLLSEPAWAVVFLLALVLAVGLFREAADFGQRPEAYMRSRLWSTLAPTQVLAPGDPVPTQGAAS